MKKLYLHIGTHKTGTSYLQAISLIYKGSLSKQGIHYEREHNILGKDLMRISPLTHDGLKYHTYNFQHKHMFIKEPSILMISEGFFGDPFNGYDNIKAIATDLALITKGYDVKIIVFTREQDTFIESLYNQRIKEGKTDTFKQFIEVLDIHAYKWDNLIDEYRKIFGKDKVTVKRYEDMRVLEDTVEWLELKCEIGHREPVNVGLSSTGLEILRIANPILSPLEQEKLRKVLEKEFHKLPYQPYGLFTDKEREELLEYYKRGGE